MCTWVTSIEILRLRKPQVWCSESHGVLSITIQRRICTKSIKIHCCLYRPQTRGNHIPETHEQTTSPLWQVSTLNIRSITDCHIGHTRFANSLYCICTVRLQITNESNRQSCTTASNSMLRIENPECSEPNNLDHIQNDKFAVFRLLMPGSHNLPKSHPHGYTMADLSVSKPRNRQLFRQSVSPFPSPKKSVQD